MGVVFATCLLRRGGMGGVSVLIYSLLWSWIDACVLLLRVVVVVVGVRVLGLTCAIPELLVRRGWAMGYLYFPSLLYYYYTFYIPLLINGFVASLPSA